MDYTDNTRSLSDRSSHIADREAQSALSRSLWTHIGDKSSGASASGESTSSRNSNDQWIDFASADIYGKASDVQEPVRKAESLRNYHSTIPGDTDHSMNQGGAQAIDRTMLEDMNMTELFMQQLPVEGGWRGAFKESHYADGKVRREYDDGAILEKRTNGLVIYESPDHSLLIKLPSGEELNAIPTYPEKGIRSREISDDGTATYNYNDGTQELLYPDHRRLVTNPDGSWELEYPDGGILLVDKDGNRLTYDENGDLIEQLKKYPDDTEVEMDGHGRVVSVTGPDGRMREFRYDDNGELTEIEGHLGTWKRTVDNNGRVAWVDQNTGQVWEGDFRVDSDGNLHYVPQKGQNYVFTRDGRDVKVSDPKEVT